MNRSASNELAAALRCERWSAAEARVVLRAAAESGLSAYAFAIRHQLEPQRLYWWLRRLEEGSGAGTVRFEELAVGPAARTPANLEDCIEVELRSGHVVRLSAGFDGEALLRLLAVLDAAEARC